MQCSAVLCTYDAFERLWVMEEEAGLDTVIRVEVGVSVGRGGMHGCAVGGLGLNCVVLG